MFYLFILVFLCVRCWGLGFEFCVFVAGWRHALRSEWLFISSSSSSIILPYAKYMAYKSHMNFLKFIIVNSFFEV